MTITTRRRLAFWCTVGLAIAAALFLALRPRPVPVDFAEVTRGALAETLDHEGRTRVRERYVVSAPVAGRVLRIELRPGDRVVANQTVVATFAPAAASLLDARTRAEAQSRVSAAEAMLEQARAQREQVRVQSQHAIDERDRATGLEKIGLVTTEARQAAEADAASRQRALEAAEAAVRAATHEVEAARAMLVEPGSRAGADAGRAVTLSLRAPIDGVVLERHRESEAVVMQGEPLVTVGDTSAIEVIADYLSADAVKIQPAMRAMVDQWGGGQPLDAVVDRVEPAGFLKVSALGVEEQRVWVVLRFNQPADSRRALGDGYRVEARVIVWAATDVVRVPISALFRRGDGWAVFVDEGGAARERAVTIGHRNGSFAEVLSGLTPGLRVVTYPPEGVADGTLVRPR
jgi:HlyD family secretion protein